MTLFVFSVLFFSKMGPFFDVGKSGKARHATDDNMAKALCVLDN